MVAVRRNQKNEEAQNGTERAPDIFRHYTRPIRAVDCQSESRGPRTQRQQWDRLEIRRRSPVELLARIPAINRAMSAHPNVCQRLIRIRKTPISRRAEHHKTLNLGIRQSPAPGSESKI